MSANKIVPSGAWRDGSHAVVKASGSVLPDICVCTGAAAEGNRQIVRIIRVHPRGRVGGVVALAKSAANMPAVAVEIGISKQAASAHFMRLVAIYTVVILGFLMALSPVIYQTVVVTPGYPKWGGFVQLPGILLIVGGVLAALRFGQPFITAVGKSDDHVWLAGVHKNALAVLPAWPSANKKNS